MSFDNLEDEEIEARGAANWESIIPEDKRAQVDEEERQKQLLELNLPPRERKQIRDINNLMDSDEEKRRRRRKKDDDSDDSDDDSEDDKPKKRGRNRKEQIGGCTDSEIRRFIKSFKKFPRPLER